MQARTSKNMECLSMELKAFEKSRRRVHYSLGGMLASLWTEFTACTMASDPTLTPTPNWSGVRVSMASDRARWERHLDVRRRRTSPTAMGRRPPPFFLDARRVAPQRCGMISGGQWPAHRSWMTPVSARVA